MRKLKILVATLAMTLLLAAPAFATHGGGGFGATAIAFEGGGFFGGGQEFAFAQAGPATALAAEGNFRFFFDRD